MIHLKMVHLLHAAILCSLIHSMGAVADHTLIHNQTLAFGRSLVSADQLFELGFFHPGNSTNIFLGIWYKSTPNVVVWVANRNNPITFSQGLALAISENGTLAITGGGIVLWSANPSTAASRPRARLLNTGNLVVANETMDDGGGGYLWQSFDYPTDTWLPEMTMLDAAGDGGEERFLTSWKNSDDPSVGEFSYKIENQGLAQLVVYRGKIKTFRTGMFNGIYFSGIASFPNLICTPKLVFREERLLSVMIRPYKNSVIAISKVSVSGLTQRFTMNARRDRWLPVDSYPRDQCDEYGHCGYNGICSIENAQRCSCFRGYSPRSEDDWERQDWSSGCSRIAGFKCDESRDGFVEVRGVRHPDLLSHRYWLNISMSLDECKAECLKNCDCTACANPYITNGGSGCLMWYGDLLDTRIFHGADEKQNIYIRVPLSELDSGTSLEEEEEKEKRPIKIILISIAAGILVSSFINGGLLLLKRRKERALKGKDELIDLPLIKMATILEATNSFSKDNLIGRGGFGPVYMGTMLSGEQVAVKRLSRTSGQGLEEFKNEVVLIAKLQHRNLVRLLGCCIDGEERMLIYEYLHNKSLDYFVSDPNQRSLLTWPKRFDIIMGIAKGLLYLHHDSRLKIIHRDLKTSNILLDANLNPKISDFGLARVFQEDQSISRTRRVIGTYGYMSPEYAFHGKFSVKSDVFSLGVVLLEIITGRKNRGFEHNDHHHSLLSHVWLLWKEKRISEVMDKCLIDTYMESQVKRCIHVGLLCVQRLAEDRPVMPSVVLMLASDGEILPEPNEPGFFIDERCSRLESCMSTYAVSENGTVTITDLEAR